MENDDAKKVRELKRYLEKAVQDALNEVRRSQRDGSDPQVVVQVFR